MNQLPENIKQHLITYVNGKKWTFAKTMAAIPHFYLIERNCPTFTALAKAISAYGQDETFYRRTYRYLYLDGYKYWHMTTHDRAGFAWLINRAKVT